MSVLAMDAFGERIQALRPGYAQAVTISASTQVSSSFTDGTTVIRVVATAPCFIAFGPVPVAAIGTGHYLPQSSPEYFRVAPGDRLATIRAGADGLLHISEMS